MFEIVYSPSRSFLFRVYGTLDVLLPFELPNKLPIFPEILQYFFLRKHWPSYEASQISKLLLLYTI